MYGLVLIVILYRGGRYAKVRVRRVGEEWKVTSIQHSFSYLCCVCWIRFRELSFNKSNRGTHPHSSHRKPSYPVGTAQSEGNEAKPHDTVVIA